MRKMGRALVLSVLSVLVLALAGCGPAADSPYVEVRGSGNIRVWNPCGALVAKVEVARKPSPGIFEEVWAAQAQAGMAGLEVVLFQANSGYDVHPASFTLEPGMTYVVSVNGSETGTVINEAQPQPGYIAWDTTTFPADQFAKNDKRIRNSMGCA